MLRHRQGPPRRDLGSTVFVWQPKKQGCGHRAPPNRPPTPRPPGLASLHMPCFCALRGEKGGVRREAKLPAPGACIEALFTVPLPGHGLGVVDAVPGPGSPRAPPSTAAGAHPRTTPTSQGGRPGQACWWGPAAASTCPSPTELNRTLLLCPRLGHASPRHEHTRCSPRGRWICTKTWK